MTSISEPRKHLPEGRRSRGMDADAVFKSLDRGKLRAGLASRGSQDCVDRILTGADTVASLSGINDAVVLATGNTLFHEKAESRLWAAANLGGGFLIPAGADALGTLGRALGLTDEARDVKRAVDAVAVRPGGEMVYNFAVEDLHNYAVGPGVLVHNNCRVNGNSYSSTRPATLYEKYDANDNFLKHGISQDPARRYTEAELNGGYLLEKLSGPRRDIAAIERDLVERMPGPENFERWAGRRLGE